MSSTSSDYSESLSDSEESSSDWDVTSSDNDSSDNTTLDIYDGTSSARSNDLPALSPSLSMSHSYRSSEFDIYHFNYSGSGDALIGEHNYRRYSHHDVIGNRDRDGDRDKEKVPFLAKMRSFHQNLDTETDTNNNNKQETDITVHELAIDLGYYLYSLFYPYTNYQDLLFSQQFLYKKEKKSKKAFYEEDDDDPEQHQDISSAMDWNNVKHIDRISGLLSRLLKTAGSKGISEISLYQMFCSPSPLRIIYELRFGLYSHLCLIHLNRFGERTFCSNSKEEYHFNADLSNVDVIGLSDYIGDDILSPIVMSSTPTIKEDKNMVNITQIKPIKPIKPTPIQTKKRKKTNSRTRASSHQSASAHSTPIKANKSVNKCLKKRSGSVRIKSPKKILKKRITKRTITTTTRKTRKTRVINNKKQSVNKRKKEKKRKEMAANYTITTLFKRRLSKKNEKLLNGLKEFKHLQKVREKEKKKRKRRRRITIEEMGHGKWCTIQINHQFLVSGFIRNIAVNNIGLSIVKLIGMFYYSSSHLLLISGSMECKNTKHNQIHILGISNKKRYKIKLNRFKNDRRHSLSVNKKKMKQLQHRKRSKTPQPTKKNKKNNNKKNKISSKTKRSNRDVSFNLYFDRYNLGNCFATSISLPLWPWLKDKFVSSSIPIHHKGKYGVIIRSGGTYTYNENVSTENDIIIFNSKHLYHTHCSSRKHIKKKKISKPKIINGYYSKLPSFKKGIEYLSVIYDCSTSYLYSFGGLNLGRSMKSISQLKLNVNSYKYLKWKKCASLKKARYACSLLKNGYYSSSIAIIGGLNSNSKEMRNVELFNCDNGECVQIAAMNEGRSKCGSCYIQDLNGGSIIVCGGVKYGDGSKQIELFDANKNKWKIHYAKTNYKHSFPTIWNDEINPNIIYIAGDNIGITDKNGLGFIEWCDLRDSNKKLFNVLYENSIDKLWRFRLLSRHRNHKNNNGWESRALFSM